MNFNDFDSELANDLLATLEAQSTDGHMDLCLSIGTLDDGCISQPGGSMRERRNVPEQDSRNRSVSTANTPKLERVESRTGRPEEIFKYNSVRKLNQGRTTIIVGDYQLGEKLGKGAFGTVYKGLDRRTGQFVAIKRLNISLVDSEVMMKEIELLKKFQHNNIVKYICAIKTEKHMNVVLEYVDSGSLAHVLSGFGFFPESLSAIYVSQVLEGLDYLHSQQVIHRDIKGANLLITREGSIKLSDFGIATVVHVKQRNSSLVQGSPYWMAPEVIEMSHSTTASDIWSLGCTIIELLTGFPPYFEMVAMSAIYKMVREECPPLPDDISEELEDFLKKCFRRNPDERPSAKELRAHPWIIQYAPQVVQNTPPVMDVEEVRSTIKTYTLTKEGGKKAKKQLQQSQPLTQALSSSKEMETTSPSFSSPQTPTKRKHRRVKSTIFSSEQSAIKLATSEEIDLSFQQSQAQLDSEIDKKFSNKRGRKSTLGKFLGGKKARESSKIKRGSTSATLNSPGPITEPDKSLIALNIYSVETRKGLFAFTIFHIKVMQDSKIWDIERTWSDFKQLHTQLVQQFPNEDLPNCPKAKFWGVMDPDFIRKRWQDLQHFLVRILQNKVVLESETFLNWISTR